MRPALATDRRQMLAITADVWEGNDYVPFVWDDWLRDPDGLLMVASVGPEVVGFQHGQIQPDASVWLEGIRVASERRGEGIGAALLRYGLQWARTIGSPVVRLSTSSGNEASAALARRSGFEATHRFVSARGEGLSTEDRAESRVAGPVDEDAVWSFIEERLPGEPRLYTEGWTAYVLTRERLNLLLATHAVLVSANRSIEGLAIATTTRTRQTPRIGLLVGARSAAAELASAVRAVAPPALGARATVQDDGDGPAALEDAGFTRGEYQMILFEKYLSA